MSMRFDEESAAHPNRRSRTTVRYQKRKSMIATIHGDVSCVFERDPAARHRLEVLTTYPGVHAIIGYRIANLLWRGNFRYIARLISYFVRVWTNIDIHPGATIGPRFFIDHGAGVVIGETAEIGANVTLYHGVTLGGTSWSKGKRHPTLEAGVLVGAGAKILGPIVVGAGSRVGANSVVTKNVPPGRSVVGIPAKVVHILKVGQINPYGIDLNHHLIPDPVGKAISSLMERITLLEAQLDETRRNTLAANDRNHQCCDFALESEAKRPVRSVSL